MRRRRRTRTSTRCLLGRWVREVRGLCVPLSDDPGVVPSREAAGAALSGWPAVGVRREGYCSSMPALLTGRTVRVLIGTERKNLVTRDVSEVKVTWEGFAGDNHEGLTRPADVRVKWFPRACPSATRGRCRWCPTRSSRSLPARWSCRSQYRRRVGHQNLTAVPGGHHPRSAVEHRPEVVPVAQLCLTGRHAHPHRQLQGPLRGHCGIDSRLRRRECCAHPVTGVLEQASPRAPESPDVALRRGRRGPFRIASASASHRRVDPSTSVNRNVTTPEGAAAGSADTHAESHKRHAPTSYIGACGPVTGCTCI